MVLFPLIFITFWFQVMSNLIVRYPKELIARFSNSTLQIGLGNFGMIPYGHTIIGKLYYNPDIEGESFGCTPFKNLLIPAEPKVDQSPIIMVDRGGNCSFVTKARNINEAKGHVALIINNQFNQTVSNIVMADDGRGSEIQIPSIIISKEDGDALKKFWIENKQNPSVLSKITLEIEFSMESTENIVEYDIWYTPDQEAVYKILGEFYIYHIFLANQTKLNIHIATYSHYDYDSTKKNKMDHCLGSGKYCARPIPAIEGKRNMTNGTAVVFEGIKQKCIYSISLANNDTSMYWKYMYMFYTNCIKGYDFTEVCSSKSSKQAGLPLDQINKCYNESFGLTKEENQHPESKYLFDNKILNEELKERDEWYISRVPAIFVNKRLFLSSWRGDYLFEGICAGLKKKPQVCFSDGYFSKEKKKSTSTIVLIVLLIISVNIVIFYFCIRVIRNYIKDKLNSSDISNKVESVVHSYLQMKGNQ